MEIEYHINEQVTADEFIDLLHASTLGERRPVDDHDCIRGMIRHSNLMITARDSSFLVGGARCMTDFYYACYLSDLAVDARYQGLGIGTELQTRILDQLGPRCKLILLAAPAADGWYKKQGFSRHPRCWILQLDAAGPG